MPQLQPGQAPPPDYYASNLDLLIDEVARRNADLLAPSECAFVDGWRGPEEYFTPEEAIFDSSSDISPTELDRSMTLDEIDRVVGAERQRLGPVTTEIGELDTWAYPDAGLVVQLHDGRFFSAQTI